VADAQLGAAAGPGEAAVARAVEFSIGVKWERT
jgi:hypothetical protein